MTSDTLPELSERERIAFDALHGQGRVSVDAVESALTRAGIPLRSGSVNTLMKYLAAKLAPKGFILERVSKLGRGHKGEYELRSSDPATP